MFIFFLSGPFSLIPALFAVFEGIFNPSERGDALLTQFCRLFA
jgi:hypothetical protein